MIIAVIGASIATPRISQLAEDVGSRLATEGVAIVCGGLGGVMEAVCRGAKLKGGTTIGILPGNDPSVANNWVDMPICTGMGYARNLIVVRSGRSVISIGGAYGTLSEIGHALSDGIPVIALETWGLTRDGLEDKAMTVSVDPADAVRQALIAAGARTLS